MSVVTELRRTARSARAEKGAPTRRPLRRGDGRSAAIFLAPWFLGLVLITIGPMIASLYLSFTDYNLLAPPKWIGLENYTRMFEDPRLLNSLRVTFTYVFVSVPLQLAVALALALLLDRGLRGLAFYRSVFYLPSLLGGERRDRHPVAPDLRHRRPASTRCSRCFGIEGQGWISDPDTALGTLILLHVWTFGVADGDLPGRACGRSRTMYYEAASVDGAGSAAPVLSASRCRCSRRSSSSTWCCRSSARSSPSRRRSSSRGGTGGPVDSTLFYTLYLYQQGFANFDMGYASAMAWFLLVIIARAHRAQLLRLEVSGCSTTTEIDDATPPTARARDARRRPPSSAAAPPPSAAARALVLARRR